MNLAQAIENFIDEVPEDPCGHDETLNECIEHIQKALGQPYGDAASIYFSGSEWFIKWCDAQDREAKKQIVFEYVKYELNQLPINTDLFKWAVTPSGYFFKVECPIDKEIFNGRLFTCKFSALSELASICGSDGIEDLGQCPYRITKDKVMLDDRGCSDGVVIRHLERFLNNFEI